MSIEQINIDWVQQLRPVHVITILLSVDSRLLWSVYIWPQMDEMKQDTRDYWANKTNSDRHPECRAIVTTYMDTYDKRHLPAALRCNLWVREATGQTRASECLYTISRMSGDAYETTFKNNPVPNLRCIINQNAIDELEATDSSWYCRVSARRIHKTLNKQHTDTGLY